MLLGLGWGSIFLFFCADELDNIEELENDCCCWSSVLNLLISLLSTALVWLLFFMLAFEFVFVVNECMI